MSAVKRVKRPDPITNPAAMYDENAEAIYHALRPLDETAAEMERKWGVDRLPGLVGSDTAAKFGTAKAKLDTAIRDGDVQAVIKRAAIMRRGWLALDREAEQSGATRLENEVWMAKSDDGRVYAIAKTHACARAVAPEMPDCVVYSLDEVVRLLDAKQLVNVVKDTFPGATVWNVSTDTELNDDVPF